MSMEANRIPTPDSPIDPAVIADDVLVDRIGREFRRGDAYEFFASGAERSLRTSMRSEIDTAGLVAVCAFCVSVVGFLSALTVLLFTGSTAIPLGISVVSNLLLLSSVAIGIFSSK